MSIANMLKVWWRGKSGERDVKKITGLLSKDKFEIIHDLILPISYRDLSTTQIDHCIISLETRDIFVIETKNVKGAIIGDVSDEHWKLKTEANEYEIHNYLRQNYAHIQGVIDVFEKNKTFFPFSNIHSVVCILDNDKVNITSEKRNMSSSFNPDCIVTNAGDFLSKIVDTVAASERITYRNDMKDIAKLLNEKNMNTGVIKKFFVNRKHVSDLKKYHENTNKIKM